MSNEDDFYASINLSPGTNTLDGYIQGRSVQGGYFDAMQGLTENGQAKNALQVPVDAGQRVSFTHNLGSVLTYSHVPEVDVLGTVIMVRTADGDCTYQEDMVFVKWDDGAFLPVHRHHLRAAANLNQKQANAFVLRANTIGDLAALFATDDKKGDLIHKSTKDLWSFEDRDGEFVISRLFDDTGDPLQA